VLRRYEIINKIKRKRDCFFLDKSEIFSNMQSIEGKKILSSIKKPFFIYTEDKYLIDKSFLIIKTKENVSLKYLFAILSSKVIAYYLNDKNIKNINQKVLCSIPIKKSKDIEVFEIVVDYILFLKTLDKPINEYVSNEHIIISFEQVLNAMVFELYFKKEFMALKNKVYSKELVFIKYAKEDYKSIKELDKTNKKQIINESFKTLKEPYNLIRNNLILMGIELENLIVNINRSLNNENR